MNEWIEPASFTEPPNTDACDNCNDAACDNCGLCGCSEHEAAAQ